MTAAHVGAAVDAADVVAEPGHVITFARHCATEQPHRVQAYGRFASASPTGDALGLVIAGYTGLGGSPVIGFTLEAVRLRGLTDWRGDSFGIALVVEHGSASAVGAPVSEYLEGLSREAPSPRPFRMDDAGDYDWLTFVEPDDRQGRGQHHLVAPLSVPYAGLPQAAPLQLRLVVRNTRSDETFTLAGPAAIPPTEIMAAPAPQLRALGLMATLNPRQEGGLYHTLREAFEYRHCIDERRAAKRAFPSYPNG